MFTSTSIFNIYLVKFFFFFFFFFFPLKNDEKYIFNPTVNIILRIKCQLQSLSRYPRKWQLQFNINFNFINNSTSIQVNFNCNNKPTFNIILQLKCQLQSLSIYPRKWQLQFNINFNCINNSTPFKSTSTVITHLFGFFFFFFFFFFLHCVE